LGLLAEDYDTATRQLAGNFPQAYSHVGLIRAAFAAAPRWGEVL
jgi:GH15 family glucan-1,4-alpha-glucosidase